MRHEEAPLLHHRVDGPVAGRHDPHPRRNVLRGLVHPHTAGGVGVNLNDAWLRFGRGCRVRHQVDPRPRQGRGAGRDLGHEVGQQRRPRCLRRVPARRPARAGGTPVRERRDAVPVHLRRHDGRLGAADRRDGGLPRVHREGLDSCQDQQQRLLPRPAGRGPGDVDVLRLGGIRDAQDRRVARAAVGVRHEVPRPARRRYGGRVPELRGVQDDRQVADLRLRRQVRHRAGHALGGGVGTYLDPVQWGRHHFSLRTMTVPAGVPAGTASCLPRDRTRGRLRRSSTSSFSGRYPFSHGTTSS